MRPTRGDLIGAGLLFGVLTLIIVIMVAASIPPGGPPTLH
jgi:hypothetical protein